MAIVFLARHIFKRHHPQSRWGYGAKPLTWHLYTSNANLHATPLTEQVGIWSKTTNMAIFLLARHIFKRHHSQSRWGYGAKPLTWQLFSSKAYLQATPPTEQVGIWSKTTNMACFFTSKAYLQATPLTDPVGIWSKTTNMACFFLLARHIFQRHHSRSRWGKWSKTTNMAFFY